MIILMCVLLIWLVKCYGDFLRSLIRRRRRTTNTLITHTSSPSTSVWDQLPDEISDYIFAKLRIADRVRMMSVCKSWRNTLMQDHIPVAPEPPWRIISQDSYSKPKYSLHEICFESFDRKNYRFSLPIAGQWWCCGSSGGWLLMAGCGWDELLEDADILLWNPISGATTKLPALSTYWLFSHFIDNCLDKGIESISPFIKRTHVFSVESAKCVVAVIFEDPTNYPHSYLALCTPQDESWIDVDVEGISIFNDICFHNGKLYASCKKLNSLEAEANETIRREAKCRIGLKDCDVEVNVLRLIYKGVIEPGFIQGGGLDKHERTEIVDHLVPEMSGELLAVSAIRDLWFYLDEDPIESFVYYQTSKFEVRRLVDSNDCLEKLDGIGEQAIFVGSKSSVSLPHRIEGADSNIYFAIDDATGVFIDANEDDVNFHDNDLDKMYRFREEGIFDLRQNLIEETFLTSLRMQSGSTTGWFTPKLF